MGLNDFFASKILALSVIILCFSTFVSVLCSLFPWWFRLHFGPEDATYGSLGPQEADMDIGAFWIFKPNKPGADRNRVLMTSLLALDRASNLPVVPVTFRLAQVCYFLGLLGTMLGFGGGTVLALRKKGSLTGNCGLSIFSVLGAIMQVTAILLFLITSFNDNEWHMLPLENPYRIVITSHPTMYLNWAFYIAIIGTGLSVVGTALLLVETMKVCQTVEAIREQQRREAPNWYPDIQYTKFSYADMQPTKQYSAGYSAGNYGPPQQQFFAQPQPMPLAPRYGGGGYQPSPSPISPSPNTSREYIHPEAGYVSREINL